MPVKRRGSRLTRIACRAARLSAATLAAMLILGGALALGALRAGGYVGRTSEQRPVTFTVTHGRIAHFKAELGYNGQCGQGGGPDLTAAPPAIAVGRGGRFAVSVRLKLGTLVNDPGRIEGRASHSTVTGKVIQLLDGKPNRCYTETFTARRR
jgi:hypothetical protein